MPQRLNDHDHAALEFTDDYGTFTLPAPQRVSYLYFPLANEAGMMSSITPCGQGDAKTGQSAFLLTPVTVEDLHHASYGRNVWVHLEDGTTWSAMGVSAGQRVDGSDEVTLEAGLLWHKTTRHNTSIGIQAEIINFVPARGTAVELMEVRMTNIGDRERTMTATAAIPLFARSADNVRDHRHVTSLLHRVATTPWGVTVRPTLVFDERGHRPNMTSYGVFGCGPAGATPRGFFPLVHDFVGEGGSLDWPAAVIANQQAAARAGESFAGYEAMGGLRFDTVTLQPGDVAVFRLVLGIAGSGDHAEHLRYLAEDHFDAALDATRAHWRDKVDQLSFHTGDDNYDRWTRWVTIQPILRRIYGCSFLPFHDYGRGGRGWRDLWQDCLALLLCEPDGVGDVLFGNFAGVRIDGSNATIIGTAPGSFVADRNSIPRVWMDHAAWPWLTTKLYLDQTGDLQFLLRKQNYFRDAHVERCRALDTGWSPEAGTILTTRDGDIYAGSILEHLIIQHVTSFLNVGDHGNIRLEGADWNDGLDQAQDRGESVALTSLYGSNLIEIGQILEAMSDRHGVDEIPLLEEAVGLFADFSGTPDASPAAKRARLEEFMRRCADGVSGRTVGVPVDKLAADLQHKGRSLLEHVRGSEWVVTRDQGGWFNGYYDNEGRRVEGDAAPGVRMTLTGQVFAVMSGAATDDQVEEILHSAERHLWDDRVGGYRLNSDFKDADVRLGRCFGFAFGHKENGAMFCHMAVMFAFALYARGRAREGHRILHTIHKQCLDFEASKVYPGIPEYFDARGRGLYPYLTGSASWYLLTLLTMAYGIRGHLGDLSLQPRLLADQFDDNNEASARTRFADRRLRVVYHNAQRRDAVDCRIQRITLHDQDVPFVDHEGMTVIERGVIASLDSTVENELHVELA